MGKWKYPTNTPTYAAWINMRLRCSNPDHAQWKHYGGRGILCCALWLESYDAFVEDMGFRPNECFTLDRIDNNGNYEKLNCRWTDWKTQSRNKRSNRNIQTLESIKTLMEVSEKSGVPYSTLRSRITAKIPLDRATIPDRLREHAGKYTTKCRCLDCMQGKAEYARNRRARRAGRALTYDL